MRTRRLVWISMALLALAVTAASASAEPAKANGPTGKPVFGARDSRSTGSETAGRGYGPFNLNEGIRIRVTSESRTLWNRLGALMTRYHQKTWELWTLQDADKPNAKAIETKRAELLDLQQQIDAVRGGLNQYRVAGQGLQQGHEQNKDRHEGADSRQGHKDQDGNRGPFGHRD
jgi:hypothetical protein